MSGDADIFWSREPITGPKGTKENPAIIPSFNDHRVVGLEIEQACDRLRVRLRMACLHQPPFPDTTCPCLANRASSGLDLRQAPCTLLRGSTSSAPLAPSLLRLSTPRHARRRTRYSRCEFSSDAGCSRWRAASTEFTIFRRGRRRVCREEGFARRWGNGGGPSGALPPR